MNIKNIHPTALVHPEAQIEQNVSIGPFSVIDAGVHIKEGCMIDGHVALRGRTTIGENCRIGWGSVIGADPQDLHFDSSIESGVTLGADNTLREYVTIHRSTSPAGMTRVGAGNFLMTGVHLAHDVSIGDGNIFANNVLLAGHIHVGKKTFLGGGAGFHQFIRIGDYAIVQGNSSITQDVPPYCLIYGANNFGGLNIVGLKRNGFSPELRLEIKTIAKKLLQSGNIKLALAEVTHLHLHPATQILVAAVANPSRKGIITGSART